MNQQSPTTMRFCQAELAILILSSREKKSAKKGNLAQGLAWKGNHKWNHHVEDGMVVCKIENRGIDSESTVVSSCAQFGLDYEQQSVN
jgi:hypothetical protein